MQTCCLYIQIVYCKQIHMLLNNLKKETFRSLIITRSTFVFPCYFFIICQVGCYQQLTIINYVMNMSVHNHLSIHINDDCQRRISGLNAIYCLLALYKCSSSLHSHMSVSVSVSWYLGPHWALSLFRKLCRFVGNVSTYMKLVFII